MPSPLAPPLILRRILLGTALALGLVVAFAGLARAEPALWKVTNGISTAYLFGSVHQLKHQTGHAIYSGITARYKCDRLPGTGQP